MTSTSYPSWGRFGTRNDSKNCVQLRSKIGIKGLPRRKMPCATSNQRLKRVPNPNPEAFREALPDCGESREGLLDCGPFGSDFQAWKRRASNLVVFWTLSKIGLRTLCRIWKLNVRPPHGHYSGQCGHNAWSSGEYQIFFQSAEKWTGMK